MFKKILLVGIVLSLLISPKVWAGTFNLKSISGVDTSGKQLSHWWYTGNRAVFSGEAVAGSSVEVEVDSQTSSTTADGEGNWSATVDLSEGDHTVKLSSGGSTINFTLTTGTSNVDWEAVEAGEGEALPAAGNTWPGIILLTGGLVGIMIGGKMWRVYKV